MEDLNLELIKEFVRYKINKNVKQILGVNILGDLITIEYRTKMEPIEVTVSINQIEDFKDE